MFFIIFLNNIFFAKDSITKVGICPKFAWLRLAKYTIYLVLIYRAGNVGADLLYIVDGSVGI